MNHGDDGFFKKTAAKTFTDSVQKWINRQLTPADLADADIIGELLDHAVASNRWAAGERGEHEFFTLCVHCAEAGDKPGALLTGVVFLGKPARPTNAQELRAEQLLLQRRRSRPRSQTPHATKIRAAAARVAESMTPAPPVRRSLREVFARLKEASEKERQQ